MNGLTIGSLFSGAGWLDLAVEDVFNARTAWHCEWDKAASKVLARHWPDVPNHHDAAATDWATVEPVDIICGGSPCQDVSMAGARKGMTEGTRSNLWVAMRDAIATIQPVYVIWENVSGSRSATATSNMESDEGLLGDHPAGQPVLRALGRVLGDLASFGFDAEWRSLRAADVGACHGRERVFVLAYHPGRVAALADAERGGRDRRTREPQRATEPRTVTAGSGSDAGNGARELTLLPTPAACNPNDGEHPDTWLARRERVKQTANNGNGMGMPLGIAVQLLPTPTAADSGASGGSHPGAITLTDATVRTAMGTVPNPRHLLPTPTTRDYKDNTIRREPHRPDDTDTLARALVGHLTNWGEYEPAIRRAEHAHGHPAPPPTEPGRNSNPRLSAQFAEWMMMAQPGWITDTPGVSRNDALKIAGNGVVQPQAAAALRHMLGSI